MFPTLKILMVASAVSSTPMLRADTLIANPGFESGEEEWVLFIPPEHVGAPVEWTIANDESQSGAASASVKSGEPVRFALSSKKVISVAPGEKYRIRAWLKFSKDAEISGDGPVAYIRATLSEASKLDIADALGHFHIGLTGDVARNPAVQKLAVLQVPKGWRKIEAVIEIPDGAALMGLNLFTHGVTGTVYWDDVSVELVPPQTQLSRVIE